MEHFGMPIPKRSINLVAVLFLCITPVFIISCSSYYLNQYSESKIPPHVGLRIEISDLKQKDMADSLLIDLASQLKLYATEYRKFTLATSPESTDLVLKVKVLRFNVLGSDTQNVVERQRKMGIEVSEDDTLKKKKIAQIIATNVAVNVLANMVTIPLGFASITVIKDNSIPAFNAEGYAWALLACKFELYGGSRKLWERCTEHRFHLTGPTNEHEQMSVLKRNTILEIQDYLPVFLWRPPPDWIIQ
jgi:hypothetical protein